MSSARSKRRKIEVVPFDQDYDSCEEDLGWKHDPGWGPESVEPPEPVRKYRSYWLHKKTVWLRALRSLHKDLLHRAIESARVARTPAASAKHLEGEQAVRVRWQSIVQQVADKCLPLPLRARWHGGRWDRGPTPDCLLG